MDEEEEEEHEETKRRNKNFDREKWRRNKTVMKEKSAKERKRWALVFDLVWNELQVDVSNYVHEEESLKIQQLTEKNLFISRHRCTTHTHTLISNVLFSAEHLKSASNIKHTPTQYYTL